MWLKKIVMRKTQFCIIMLLSMMAAAILTACVSFAIETQDFVKEYYSSENSPIVFTVLARDDGAEILNDDEEISKEISKLEEGKAKLVEKAFYVNDDKISNEGNFFYALKDKKELDYAVSIRDGEEKKAPGNDEIWVSHIFAKAYDVETGDRFRIGKDKEYKVSAIVNTALCSSGFLDCYPFYVNEQVMDDIDGKEGYFLNIYTKDDMPLKDFLELLPEEFQQRKMFMIDRSNLKMCMSTLAGIFGGVGVVAAIVILCVSLVVFRYLVRATISREYQMIGTYKALGRENKEIKGIYRKAYMLSGAVGIFLGIFLARPLASYLGRIVLGGDKGFELTGYTMLVGGIVLLFMGMVLWLNISGELRKINRISPIQAMNLETPSSKEKLNKSLIPNTSSSAAMAVNGLWKRKGMSLLIVMILTISVYMDVMAGEVAVTLNHYADDRHVWDNLPGYDCVVKTMGNKDALKFIQDADEVEDYVQAELSPNCSGIELEGTNWSNEETNPMVYENFNEKRYENVPFTNGRICTEKHEVTMSETLLKEVGKKVGDYIKISNDDKEINCLIAGSYSAMMKGGASFYMQEADFKELGFTLDYQTIMVFLKDGVDYDDFSQKFEDNVSKSLISEDFNFTEHEGDTVWEIANPICVVLFAAFAAFSILNIVNLIHTQTKERRRRYGILKAMGFTTGYICRENVISFTMQYAIAMVLTILLSEWISPILFSLACGIRFIRKPVWLLAAVGGGMYVVLMLVVAILLLTIRKIKPVELMEE